MIVTRPASSTRYALMRPLPSRWIDGASCMVPPSGRATDAIVDPEQEREPALGGIGARSRRALDHRIELDEAIERGTELVERPCARLRDEVPDAELAGDLHRLADGGE